jgi:hypothetical protein
MFTYSQRSWSDRYFILPGGLLIWLKEGKGTNIVFTLYTTFWPLQSSNWWHETLWDAYKAVIDDVKLCEMHAVFVDIATIKGLRSYWVESNEMMPQQDFLLGTLVWRSWGSRVMPESHLMLDQVFSWTSPRHGMWWFQRFFKTASFFVVRTCCSDQSVVHTCCSDRSGETIIFI